MATGDKAEMLPLVRRKVKLTGRTVPRFPLTITSQSRRSRIANFVAWPGFTSDGKRGNLGKQPAPCLGAVG